MKPDNKCLPECRWDGRYKDDPVHSPGCESPDNIEDADWWLDAMIEGMRELNESVREYD